ncbi:uncharacterized protein [Venturia canescens]|uniref:uncharacterized protein n=1 Tax=Venturia canescens TaxID=32260 RepID=UPI001C9BE7BF|nr:uncharacterized protein LOC122409700 [Venturia canescens]
MKTCVAVATLLLLFDTYGADESSKLPFTCPFECKSSRYEPICARGKSYASPCVLKLQICSGYEDVEMWKEVEACPKYDKDDDAKGTSVETIDKNGVIFRHFIDGVKTRRFAPSIQKKQRPALIIEKQTKIHDFRQPKVPTCLQSRCPSRGIQERPVCIQGIQVSNFCLIKQLLCGSHLPSLAVLLAKPCETTSSNSKVAIVSIPAT